MGEVQQAAIHLFTEGFKDFELVHSTWTHQTTCLILLRRMDGNTRLASLYFHSTNVILDLDPKLGGGVWERFNYADPTYPLDIIQLLYGRIRDYLRSRHLPGSVHLQKTEQTIDFLLAESQRLHLGLESDRITGVAVVGGD